MDGVDVTGETRLLLIAGGMPAECRLEAARWCAGGKAAWDCGRANPDEMGVGPVQQGQQKRMSALWSTEGHIPFESPVPGVRQSSAEC